MSGSEFWRKELKQGLPCTQCGYPTHRIQHFKKYATIAVKVRSTSPLNNLPSQHIAHVAIPEEQPDANTNKAVFSKPPLIQ